MIHCMNHEINKGQRKYECPARNFGKSSRRTTFVENKVVIWAKIISNDLLFIQCRLCRRKRQQFYPTTKAKEGPKNLIEKQSHHHLTKEIMQPEAKPDLKPP